MKAPLLTRIRIPDPQRVWHSSWRVDHALSYDHVTSNGVRYEQLHLCGPAAEWLKDRGEVALALWDLHTATSWMEFKSSQNALLFKLTWL